MKKYGLKIRVRSEKKNSSLARPPLPPTPSIFDEDEENDVDKEISRQALKTNALKEIEEQHKKDLEEDSSAFAYDDVYDAMKQKVVLPRMHDRQERKPKYIRNLMKQSDRRKKENEIVFERKLAKEREKDEHLFADTEKFATGPFKRKLEEQNKWLAEERLIELREEKDDVTKKKDFMSDFYFNIGKNVAFGARDKETKRLDEQIKAEEFEELRKEETREENKSDTPEKEVSLSRTIMKPQEAEDATFEKKMGSNGTEERDSSIKAAAKEKPKATYQHRNVKDAIAAAKERLLARKKAKIEG
ncbi:unnamed protein product [Arabis nemorensis]|uniref:Nuclear speckle splicing regulatory protein 1 N-terminal domain-containing protein n=1 Tax=Arabis nemorensis TaxID=586526 RepID=A0A565CSV2_9BRAS|nr:unnamed protein product [Arabis nemorensis]